VTVAGHADVDHGRVGASYRVPIQFQAPHHPRAKIFHDDVRDCGQAQSHVLSDIVLEIDGDGTLVTVRIQI
jgi:hypothetical protein